MANEFFSRLRGTMLNLFGVGGSSGFALKNNTGQAQLRDASDANWAELHSKKVKLLGTNAANGISLDVPAGLGSNVSFVLPGADGASGQVLKTDGAGTWYFADASADAQTVQSQAFTEASVSPLSIFTPPNNAKLVEIRVIVASPAAGGTPTVSVGITGQAELYMAAAESDLLTAGAYVVQPFDDVGASPSPIILTITPSGQTFSGTITISYKA